MEREEAIRRLGDIKECEVIEPTNKDKLACQLGIEALKAWQKYQAGWVGVYKPLLPGETK